MKISVNKNKVNNGITLVNYANELYTQSQQKNTQTALKIGGVKRVFSYEPDDIDETFYTKNKAILEQKKRWRILVVETLYNKKSSFRN